MIVTAVAIGLGVGLVVGGFGGGGSVLTVPALVFLLGQRPHSAGTASLVIVGISALIGLLARARAGQIRWAAGVGFGAIGTLTAVAGTILGRDLDPDILLLAFAAVILMAALPMLRRPTDTPAALLATELASPARFILIVIAGAVTGLATGLFGVGGGFLVVPVFVVALRWPIQIAVGTSLLVIVINAIASLSARVTTESFNWTVIIPVTIGAVIGTLLGKAATDRLSSTSLSRVFAALLVAVAAYTAATSMISLW